MAITAGQVVSGSRTSTPNPLVLTVSAFSAGSLAVICSYSRADALDMITGIVQTGVTWTKAVDNIPVGSVNTGVEIWYAWNISGGGGTSISITYAGAGTQSSAAVVQEFPGARTASNPFKNSNSGSQSTAPPSPFGSVSAGVDDLVVTAFGVANNGTLSISSGGFTISQQLATGGSAGRLGFFRKISAGASESGTAGHTAGNTGWAMATFAAATVDINESDSITATEDLEASTSYIRTASDIIANTDAVTRELQSDRSVSDIVAVTDSSIPDELFDRAPLDSIVVTENLSKSAFYDKILSDSILILDTSDSNSEFLFRTENIGTETPEYSEVLDLTGPGLPVGWSAVSQDTGSDPTFNGTMVTNPGANGRSYIFKQPYGQDFVNGILIDFTITDCDVLMGAGPDSLEILARMFLGDFGQMTLLINAGPDPHIRFTSTNSIVPLLIGESLEINVRISIKQESDVFITRLYLGYNNTNNREITPVILQQTIETPAYTTAIDSIIIGNASNASYGFTFSNISIKNGSDPNEYYAFSEINGIDPIQAELSGGDKIRIFGTDLDAGAVDLNLDDLTWISNASQDGGDINVISNKLQLELDSGGNPGVRGIAKFGIPLTADLIGGSDFSFDVEIDATYIDNKPSFELILFGVEIKIGNSSFILEFVTSTTTGAIARVLNKSGNNIVTDTAGTTLFEQSLFTITKNTYTIRLITFNGKVILFVDGTERIVLGINSGPAIPIIYNKSAQVLNLVTYVDSIQLKPLILVGENPMIDTDTGRLLVSGSLPEGNNVGDTAIQIRGVGGDENSPVEIEYLQPDQEFALAEGQNIALYLTEPIIKQKP
jgi:hypothetical protein